MGNLKQARKKQAKSSQISRKRKNIWSLTRYFQINFNERTQNNVDYKKELTVVFAECIFTLVVISKRLGEGCCGIVVFCLLHNA